MSQQESPAYRPNVSAHYGSTKSVLQRGAAEVQGVKQLAHRLGLGRSRAFQLLNANDPAEPTHSQLREMVRAGASSIAEDFASLAGGIFVPITAPTDTFGELAAQSVKEHAEYIAVAIRAVDGGVFSEDARCTALKEIDDTIRVLVAARRHLDPCQA